ncbi:MAG: tetratricopeptide repeat protein [Bacteroidales bacterium]|nr:tetratricopeptide repeat protein [Bacteroidales bacterium]
MRLRILTPVLAFSILLIVGCAEEKPASVMPVSTDSELALEFYETGLVAYDQLKLSLAWKNFEMAVKEDSDFFMAHFWMFFISSKESKNVAEKAFQSDVELNPGEEQVRLALKYLVDGQNKKVVEHLQNLVDLYPSDPHAHKLLYIIQFHYFKDVESAIISIERAIREIPDYPLAYNQLGYAYMELEDYENAEEALDTYIRLAPDQANPYDSKGDFFMATEQYDEAFDSYMKAYKNDSAAFGVSKKKAKKARMLQAKEAV